MSNISKFYIPPSFTELSGAPVGRQEIQDTDSVLPAANCLAMASPQMFLHIERVACSLGGSKMTHVFSLEAVLSP